MKTVLVQSPRRPEHRVGVHVQNDVEQFYYYEASLLDARLYDEWLELMDDDFRYFMPIRRNQTRRNKEEEFYERGSFAHFDDDMVAMRGRIRKALSDLSWAENPGSRTRHLVTNVIVRTCDEPDKFNVASTFLVYRNRQERQVDLFAGERRDILRQVSASADFKLVERTILLDQATVLSNNISVFF